MAARTVHICLAAINRIAGLTPTTGGICRYTQCRYVGGNAPKNSQYFPILPNTSHKSRQLSHRPRASGVVQRSRAYAANPQPPGLASTHLVVVFPEEFFVIVQRYIFYRSGYIVPDFPLIKLSGYVQSYQAVGAAYRGFIAL